MELTTSGPTEKRHRKSMDQSHPTWIHPVNQPFYQSLPKARKSTMLDQYSTNFTDVTHQNRHTFVATVGPQGDRSQRGTTLATKKAASLRPLCARPRRPCLRTLPVASNPTLRLLLKVEQKSLTQNREVLFLFRCIVGFFFLMQDYIGLGFYVKCDFIYLFCSNSLETYQIL